MKNYLALIYVAYALCNLNLVLCENIETKLNIIRSISPFPVKLNQTDVCYTEDCLDSAISLLKSVNFSVDPCDNFYKFSCDGWIANNPVPPSSSRWNNLQIIIEKVKNVSRAILDSPMDPLELKSVNQAKEFFSLCIDEVTLEKKGVAPLLHILELYGGWPAITQDWDPNKFDVNKAIADGFRLFLQEIIISIDMLKSVDNTQYLLHLNKPDEFFLPHSVLLNREKYNPKIEAYKSYFLGVAKLLGKETGAQVTDEDLMAQVEEVIEFETRLVRCNEDDKNLTLEPAVRNQHQYQHAELNLTILLHHLFSTSGITIDINQDEELLSIDQFYISNVSAILRTTNKRTVANYFAWRLVSTFGQLTTNKLRNIELKFDEVNLGLVESEARGTSCASLALGVFGMAITYKYVEQAFVGAAKNGGKHDVKSTVKLMADEIQKSLIESLNESTSWMDEETKGEAVKKLNSITAFVAYPDWLFNLSRLEQRYEGLTIVRGESFGTIMGYLQWDANKTLNLLRTIPDVHVNTWVYTPSTLSVFYRLPYNSITIPARILQAPLYRNEGLKSLNYGGIGTIIAHEVFHAIDYAGRRFDFQGDKKNWWTSATLNKFKRRASCFAEQYNDLATEVGQVDGLSTRYENIADNMGVRQSFVAYRKWVRDFNHGKEEPKLPGLEMYTSQQLFFLGYANSLCESVTNKSLQNNLLESSYSPARYRVQVPIQNFQEFAHHWNCPIGSPMNPPSEGRCVLL